MSVPALDDMDVQGVLTFGTNNGEPHLIGRRNGYNYMQALGAAGVWAFLTAGRAAGQANCSLILMSDLTANFASKVFVGSVITTPSAYVHIKSGTTTIPPLKINSGVLNNTPQDGAVEYDGNHLYFVIGGTRYQIDQQVNTVVESTVVKYKTADQQSITSSFADDTHLQTPVLLNSKYLVRCKLAVSRAASIGLKYSFSAPGTSPGMRGFIRWTMTDQFVNEHSMYADVNHLGTNMLDMPEVDQSIWLVEIEGVVETGDANGDLKLRWAATYSDINNPIIVKRYSFMEVTKIG